MDNTTVQIFAPFIMYDFNPLPYSVEIKMQIGSWENVWKSYVTIVCCWKGLAKKKCTGSVAGRGSAGRVQPSSSNTTSSSRRQAGRQTGEERGRSLSFRACPLVCHLNASEWEWVTRLANNGFCGERGETVAFHQKPRELIQHLKRNLRNSCVHFNRSVFNRFY